MSRSLVITMLLIAAALGAILLWPQFRSATPPVIPLLPSHQLARCDTIIIAPSRGSPLTLRRMSLAPIGSRWFVVRKDASGAEVRWPAAEGRPESFIQLLSGAVSSDEGSGSSDAATATTITLQDSTAGDELTLDVAEGALGGRTRVALRPDGDRRARAGVIDESLARSMSADFGAWIDTRVFPRGTQRASRLDVGGSAPVVLRRVGATWSMEAPVRTHADAGAAASLLAAAALLTFDRVAGDQAPASNGAEPIMRIETDIRTAEGADGVRYILREELAQRADTPAGSLCVIRAVLENPDRTTAPAWGPITVLMPRSSGVTDAAAASLVGATVLPPGVDLAKVSIAPASAPDRMTTWSWTIDGWSGDTGAPEIPAALADLLCRVAADERALSVDQQPSANWTLRVVDRDGNERGPVQISMTADSLTLATAHVSRLFRQDASARRVRVFLESGR